LDIPTFLLERNQSEFENQVEINLTESGVHPLSVGELLPEEELSRFLQLRVGYGYTEGTPELREAIATWYPGASAHNVLATTGTSEANFLVAWSLLRSSDTLAFMAPNFMQLDGVARGFGANVIHFKLRPELGWRLDFDEVQSVLRTKPTLISVVNPHNPTGRVMPPEDMRRLVDLTERAGVWLQVDEIYRGAEIGSAPETTSFWGTSPRVIVTCSTSKSLAHPGLRLGWIVAPEQVICECMRRQDYTTIGTSPLSQYLATWLLTPMNRARVLDRSRRILTRNAAVFGEWVSSRNRGISYLPPEAGGMVFFRYPHALSSRVLCERLRTEASVLVVAGEWFGMDGYLRVGIGGEEGMIQLGPERLGKLLDSLQIA